MNEDKVGLYERWKTEGMAESNITRVVAFILRL